jgi:hypothetical protein
VFDGHRDVEAERLPPSSVANENERYRTFHTERSVNVYHGPWFNWKSTNSDTF